jgi:hypothetical protein
METRPERSSSASPVPLRFKAIASFLLRASVSPWWVFGFSSPNRRQQIFWRGVVAERFAHVDEEIFVPRRKHKAAAELQWIFAQTVLFVSGGLSASGRRHYPSTYLGSNARTQAPLSRAASLPRLFASGPNWQNACLLSGSDVSFRHKQAQNRGAEGVHGGQSPGLGVFKPS